MPRAVDLAGMMEAYTRHKRKGNLLWQKAVAWGVKGHRKKEGKGHLGKGEENLYRWTLTYTWSDGHNHRDSLSRLDLCF